MLRLFKVTRAIPVGGSMERPRYEERSKVFKARNHADAKNQADDWQAQAKIDRWGRASALTG